MLKQGGFTLIEALVALAILAFGLMGSAALQLKALHSATRSYQHSVATLAAVDAQERLWEELGKVLLESGNDCTNLDLSQVKSDWKDHWKPPSTTQSPPPLHHADLQIEPGSGICVYDVSVTLGNEGDDGYGKVEYKVRLPSQSGGGG
ncbi:type IV pilus modification PilV family protein [Halomonas garicola]|uniref:type IV pilus modification PilV family protein n=1 Tax=Halomonas garicola TaxID=1690008 RepID=UPI00289CE3A6|nr:prepilin-type N-terminal cleavage/methylation domain-containing protein [Halomonas garicola]